VDIPRTPGKGLLQSSEFTCHCPCDTQSVYDTLLSPVIRTHPITGYKTLFVNKGSGSCSCTPITSDSHAPPSIRFTKRIVELTEDESDALLDYLFRHVAENHDLQVRFRWSTNDIAIWDNRCTFHTAT
jgi:alpha-ketoglutarate-dependent taurine dioxygenase